jgi:hypothetical protein
VGTTANVAGAVTLGGIATFSAQPIFSSLTASSAVATDASKGLVSVTNTGTGNNVLATSPTITTPVISSIVNTGTLTLPTSTDTLVGRATTDTLTNKTLTTPVISSLSSASATALTLQSAGTTAITVDTSQNVGIGTASPTNKLHVSSSGFETIKLQGTSTVSGINFVNSASSNGYIYYDNGPNMLFYTNGSERMRIDSSGNVGIGATSSGSRFHSESSANQSVGYFKNTNASNTNDVIQVAVSRNTTDGTYRAFAYYNAGASAYKFWVLDSGNCQNTNGSYGAFSDIKLKDNIVDATPKLASLMQVKVRNYNLKSDPTFKQIGVIAQELEQVFPAMVEESTDRDSEGNDLGTKTKAVKYSVFVPMLIKAMQEQQALITAQAETINALTARITALENA